MDCRIARNGLKAYSFRYILLTIFLLVFSEHNHAQNAVDSTEDASASYEEGGHLYTTFIVARLAGFDVQRSIRLAWASQVPDEKKEFDAIRGALTTVIGDEFGKRLMVTLHSLHGGDESSVLQRRKSLETLLKAGLGDKTLPDWQAGLVIHALGDAYAHTVIENGHLMAYGGLFGHAIHGHKPDSIRDAPDKYVAFASSLFICLAGREPRDELKSLQERANTLSKNRNTAVTEMQVFAASLGLTETVDLEARNDMVSFIDRPMVDATMKLMEAHFEKTKSESIAAIIK